MNKDISAGHAQASPGRSTTAPCSRRRQQRYLYSNALCQFSNQLWKWLKGNLYRYSCFLLLCVAIFTASTSVRAYEIAKDDERVLKLFIGQQDGAVDERVINIAELVKLVKPEIVEVYDIDFEAPRKYWALDFFYLLEKLEIDKARLENYQELSFICDDGYTVNSDAKKVLSPGTKPWLAIATAEQLSSDILINGRWEPYVQGKKTIGFDPFYLVWQTSGNADPKSFPWPYQLASIRFSYKSDYTGIHPKVILGSDFDSLKEQEQQDLTLGYDQFIEHCVRCHQLTGVDEKLVGGQLGVDLMRENGMLSVLDDDTLASLIGNVKTFYPKTAMPDFSDVLSWDEQKSIVRYLRVMKAN